MAERLYRVELTASFLERLDAIEVFLTEADSIRHHRQLTFDFAAHWPR